MMSERALRKKQRSVLNTIREAGIYESPLIVTDGLKSWQLVPVALKEEGFRDLDEIKTLITRTPFEEQSKLDDRPLVLKVSDRNDIIDVPILNVGNIDGCVSLEFTIKGIAPGNRRKRIREVHKPSFFVPVLVYLKGNGFFPISGYARMIDLDSAAISFELELPQEVSEAELKLARVVFQDRIWVPAECSLEVELVRSFRILSYAGGAITTARIVSPFTQPENEEKSYKSLIQKHRETSFSFKVYFSDLTSLQVRLSEVTTDGFLATLEEHELNKLPRYFVAEHIDTRIRFNVRIASEKLDFHLVSRAVGIRTQWFNFLTVAVLRYEYRLHPNDAKQVTRLMLESGSYTRRAISNLALLQGYLQFKWPIEEVLPKTKYRWLVKDRGGTIIGHTAAVRVSEILWVAIDNIGSQSYDGSWNRDFVSNWLRTFIELLDGSASDSIVQFTFSPEAGVWSRFDEVLSKSSDLVYWRDRIWSIYLLNSLDTLPIERGSFAVERLEHPEVSSTNWIEEFGLGSNLMLKSVCVGTRIGTAFVLDFEHDYSITFKRHFFLVRKLGVAAFLLTFSNYPDWASLNKGHDWNYLFPIGVEKSFSPQEEYELLALVRETIFNEGCTPYRVGIVSNLTKFTMGTEFTNFLLKPKALEYAALTLEGL